HYRVNSVFGNPFLRLLQREVEGLVKGSTETIIGVSLALSLSVASGAKQSWGRPRRCRGRTLIARLGNRRSRERRAPRGAGATSGDRSAYARRTRDTSTPPRSPRPGDPARTRTAAHARPPPARDPRVPDTRGSQCGSSTAARRG